MADGDSIDDNYGRFQGSMWLMSRKYTGIGLEVWKLVGSSTEHQEISMKTWFGGRRVVVNKNAWYSHPKDSHRDYHMDMARVYKDHIETGEYWVKNQWESRLHDFDWLVDKFSPLPTYHGRNKKVEKYYWPEDWRKYYG